MAKIYAQTFPIVWQQTTASLASSGSLSSGSFYTHGYARILGIVISSGSGVDAASAVRVRQSTDGGSNYDFITACQLSACSGSAFSIEVVGNVADIEYRGDTTASIAEFRSLWQLRPV